MNESIFKASVIIPPKNNLLAEIIHPFHEHFLNHPPGPSAPRTSPEREPPHPLHEHLLNVRWSIRFTNITMNAVLALQQVSLRCQTPDDVELRLFLDPESSQDDGGDIAHLESRTATSVQGVSGPDTAGIRTGRRRYNLCLYVEEIQSSRAFF